MTTQQKTQQWAVARACRRFSLFSRGRGWATLGLAPLADYALEMPLSPIGGTSLPSWRCGMRLLLALALALASASALGQDAPAAAVAIQDFYAAAARKLENIDCRLMGALSCGSEHRGSATLEWSASCRDAAEWRDLGRNYNGNAELVNKYKDALLFWDEYCSRHPEY